MAIRILITTVCVGLFASALFARGPFDRGSHANDRPATVPSAPTTRPVVTLLNGVYHGTVVDDDETVPCVTRFRQSASGVLGTYVVHDGAKDHYEGTLDSFKLLSDPAGQCQFRWHDKNGDGFVTVHVTPDGSMFEGSWGLEIVQSELVWKGTRGEANAQGSSPSHGTRAGQ